MAATQSFPSSVANVASARERGRLGAAFSRLLLPLAVAVAYYLGARIGFYLRFPPATTSVLWPPNSLLTAALLLTPPRRFWVVILAALPAHVLVQVNAGFPPLLIASLFVTNCCEALLAAGLVHRWSDDPARFDSFQRVLVFVGGAVLLAPLAVSFADAAAVNLIRGEPFGLVLARRLFSNVLGQLCVVPSAVLLVRKGRSWAANSTRERRVEAAILAAALLVLGAFVFHSYHSGSPYLPGGPFAVLPFLMPLLVLAALRFGAAGASLSLLTCALLATGMAVSGAAPTTDLSAEERVRALQVFLIVVGVPLLFMSALVEERRQALEAVKERLRFEGLVSEIASAFVHIPSPEMPKEFAARLERLGHFLGLDEAVLWQLGRERQLLVPVARWCAGAPSLETPQPLPAPVVALLLQRKPFVGDELAHRRRSFVALPLVAGEEVLGCLELISFDVRHVWTDAGVQGPSLIADVFASALARQRAEDALRASENMKSAVLGSLASRVAVLDRSGRIIAVNESWTRFALENGVATGDLPGVGENYIQTYPRTGVANAPDARLGIEGVLCRQLLCFDCEYTQTTTGGADRWFHLTVVPLHRPEGGAVLTHSDITERRMAETQAQRSRDELAHYQRVSTIGELTTSIAHQLNQPLTAILANAQVARRMLQPPIPEERRAELGEIVEEIIAEERRADEVIRGVRLLLRKTTPVRAIVDVHALVDDVVKLVATDVMVRRATLRHEVTDEPLLVRGDRVQLQQVLLNLLLNALDAVGESAGDRVVSVRSEERPTGVARVSVSDTGPGVAPETLGEVFKPFFSTKAHGMGMGLSIARSIVDAHGGSISATRLAEGGAAFTFSLPLAGAQSLKLLS